MQDLRFVARGGVLRAPRRRARCARGSSGCAAPRDGLAGACWAIVAGCSCCSSWPTSCGSAGAQLPQEKLLEQLGNEGSLLLLSAALTCVVAPICEEFLFRGYIFTALRNWRGTLPAALITGLLFGGVHVGSAPALDLVPLAALGFGLCLLYRYTGSLYPCIAAHSLNNSIAFAGLENCSVAGAVLIARALVACIAALIAARAQARGPDHGPLPPFAASGT